MTGLGNKGYQSLGERLAVTVIGLDREMVGTREELFTVLRETAENLEKLTTDFVLKAKEVRAGMVAELNNRMKKTYEESEKRRMDFVQATKDSLAGSRRQFDSLGEELTKKLDVNAHKFSKSAEQKIVAIGGTARVLAG